MNDDFLQHCCRGSKEKIRLCIYFSYRRLDNSFNNVIEFRHTTWWNKVVYDELAKKRITFCGMSHPLLPDEIIQNTQILYYRMHGVPELYKSPYSLVELKKLLRR